MNTPNSPVELLQQCLEAELDSLPEGSIVSLPVENLRHLIDGYTDAIELITDQQEFIYAFLEND